MLSGKNKRQAHENCPQESAVWVLVESLLCTRTLGSTVSKEMSQILLITGEISTIMFPVPAVVFWPFHLNVCFKFM